MPRGSRASFRWMRRWAARRSPTPSSSRRCRRRWTRSPPDSSSSPRRTELVQLIRTGAELAALARRLRSEPLLAVDTEAASFHRYLDRVYLLQISSREETAVVDPLATGGLEPVA